MSKRARSIEPSPTRSASQDASLSRSASPRPSNEIQSSPPSENKFWTEPGVRTLLDWYTIPENFKRMHNNHPKPGCRIKDVQLIVARFINNARDPKDDDDNARWKWKDVRDAVGYIRKQYRIAKELERTATPGSSCQGESDTVRAQILKVCPDFDRLDPVLLPIVVARTRQPVIQIPNGDIGADNVDVDNNQQQDDIEEEEEDEDDSDKFDQDFKATYALEKEINRFNGAKSWASQQVLQDKDDADSDNDTDNEDDANSENDADDGRVWNWADHQGNYRRNIRQREEAIESRERELYTVLMERDAAARKRLDEELAIKRQQVINDLAREKQEFHKDMAQRKEEFYKDMAQKKEELKCEMDKVKSDREKYFVALTEIKVLRKELELRTFTPPSTWV
ncbi:hypothetical protein BG004_000324 [Podila humilis]|nr:hypothetical protein BG004_000324 [Podila humilis]